MSSAGHTPLRVLRLYFRYPPETGGMEQHIQRLSEAQRQLGVEVINVFNRGQSSASSAIQLMPDTDFGALKPQAVRNAAFYVAAAASGRLRQAAKVGSGPLVVHAHGAWSDFIFARWLAGLLGADATVGTIHSATGNRHARPIHQLAMRQLGAVFATGRREFAAARNVVGDRAIHLPSAPDGIFLQSDSSSLRTEYDVVSVGSLVPVKRIDLVLQCAARAPSRTFAVVGNGPEYEPLKQLAAQLHLQNVTFLGPQTQTQVRDVLSRSRLFLSTSIEEGTPTAMLEAIAAGLPVVMTPSNDYDWIVDSSNGVLTKDWSIDEIIGSVERALTDPRLQIPFVRETNRDRMLSISWAENAAKVTRTMLYCADRANREARR